MGKTAGRPDFSGWARVCNELGGGWSVRRAAARIGALPRSPRPATLTMWQHKVAALAGASGVAAAAAGAHIFKPEAPWAKEVFDTSVRMQASEEMPLRARARGAAGRAPGRHARAAPRSQLAHAGLLAVSPLARRPALVGGLAAAGTTVFCGACYAVALAEDRSLGAPAPVGGALMVAAWAALAL